MQFIITIVQRQVVCIGKVTQYHIKYHHTNHPQNISSIGLFENETIEHLPLKISGVKGLNDCLNWLNECFHKWEAVQKDSAGNDFSI